MSARIMVALMAMLAVGCSARMNVNVRVASAETVRLAALQEKDRVECLALLLRTDVQVEADLRRRLDVLGEAFAAYRDVIRRTAQQLSGPTQARLQSIADALPVDRDTLEEFIAFDAAVESSRNIRSRLQATPGSAGCSHSDATVVWAVPAHRAVIFGFDAAVREAVGDLRRQIEARNTALADSGDAASTSLKSAATQARAIDKQANAALDAACRSFICNGGLSDSGFAYAVASLPEAQWSSVFNEAIAQGSNGNVDIVVKMNEQADFTVKGMRFDVSKIPEMARKATTQGLLLAAQIAGVPIRSAPSKPEENTGLASASVELASTLDTQAQREVLLVQRRRALLSLGVLVSSGGAEVKTADGRTQLKNALAAQLGALGGLLKLDDYPQ